MTFTLPVIGCSEVYTVCPTKIIGIDLNDRARIPGSESVRAGGMDGEIPEEGGLKHLHSYTPGIHLSRRDISNPVEAEIPGAWE